MSRNIKYQVQRAILQSFKQKTDKHEYRKEYKNKNNNSISKASNKVYSTGELRNILDFSTQFCVFLKEKGIKESKDITLDICQKFLDLKSVSCEYTTLVTYRSYIRKIIKILNSFYSSCNIEPEVKEKRLEINKEKKTEHLRHIRMSQKDFKCILDKARGKDRELYISLCLAYIFALRVSEIGRSIRVKDFDFKRKTLFIFRSKGGLDRTLEIPEKYLNFCRAICGGLKKEDYVVTLSKSQLQYRLRGIMKELNIGVYIRHKTSFHAIRKLSSNFYFSKIRKKKGEVKAKRQVNKILGHSASRKGLDYSYFLY